MTTEGNSQQTVHWGIIGPGGIAKAFRDGLTHSRTGRLVAIGELASVAEVPEDRSIYHKNLLPVVYVTADVAGRSKARCTRSFRSAPASTSWCFPRATRWSSTPPGSLSSPIATR